MARSTATLVLVVAVAALLTTALIALGTWQVERRAWKHALIARIEQRLAAAPIDAPGPAAWPAMAATDPAYRRVRVRGRFRHDRTALVVAATALGGGFWVMTPMRTDRGFTLLVNRGFVPSRAVAARAARQPATATVTGLLRTTEPGGGLLRANDPAADRWYSRDVAAIAAARRLTPVAPYFVDADATPNPGGSPVGGLTIVSFPDNHLAYAITWYVLAAMMIAGTAVLLRHEAGLRRTAAAAP